MAESAVRGARFEVVLAGALSGVLLSIVVLNTGSTHPGTLLGALLGAGLAWDYAGTALPRDSAATADVSSAPSGDPVETGRALRVAQAAPGDHDAAAPPAAASWEAEVPGQPAERVAEYQAVLPSHAPTVEEYVTATIDEIPSPEDSPVGPMEPDCRLVLLFALGDLFVFERAGDDDP